MNRLIAVAFLALSSASFAGPAQQTAAPAQPQAASLDELLNQVRNARAEATARNKQRETEFLRQRDQQRQLLAAARQEQETEDSTSRRLQQSFDANERQLTELNEGLRNRLGNLGEVFGVVRQVAADTKGIVDNSIVSAEYPGRGELASKLSQSKALPSIQELEGLWFTLQQEMTESGKVVKFPATIVKADGTQEQAEVVRVGVFNAIVDDTFLRYLSETGSLVELTRQPAGRYQSMASDLYDADAGEIVEFGVDPTRGQLLGLLVEAPSFWERVNQGGEVGYITMALGLVGFLVALERLAYLAQANKRIRAQLEAGGKPNPDNALGRILAVYADNKNDDVETLELKLDEAIMREVPALEARIGFIKLVAAVGPLLGLLGTVTGMIGTFQSITLFGTGDPKLMAGGISQALVTTVQGLCVAIPMVLMHGFVAGRSKGLIQILEEQTAGIIAAHAEKRK
jgi:biopolymer transport protein ExbB